MLSFEKLTSVAETYNSEILFKTKIDKGTPVQMYITKAIAETSKVTQDITKIRQKKLPVACLRQLFRLIIRPVRLSRTKMTNITVIKLFKKKLHPENY